MFSEGVVTAAASPRLTSPFLFFSPTGFPRHWGGFYGSIFLSFTSLCSLYPPWIVQRCACVFSDAVSGGLEETAEFPAATAIDLKATGRSRSWQKHTLMLDFCSH